jgi:cell division protein FtsI (penicillin-binding protein 3)
VRLQELLTPHPKTAPAPDTEVRARFGRRSLALGIGVALAYLGLIAQSSHLMLAPDAQLEAKARNQFERATIVEGRRGQLLDRNGNILATTVQLVEVHADPSLLDDGQAADLAGQLAGPLGLDENELRVRLGQRARRDVLLARDLTPDQLVAVNELERGNKVYAHALFRVDEQRRFYPGRSDAAALIGVVGRNGRGRAGLEQTLDRKLRGATHKSVRMQDRQGRAVANDELEVDPGNDLVLTIDRRIQHIAEEVVAETLVRTGAQAAHAVVMDPATGDILAMVSQPTVNPNDLASLDMEAFKNRAALDAFEPGSVMKPFIAAVALETGLVTPDSMIDCENGSWTVGRKNIGDDHPHGLISVSDVIKFSSNIGTAKLALRMGAETTLTSLARFGIGRETGLGIPGETRGRMQPADRIKPIELATTAYGHGMSASAVQLVSAMATLANGGVRMQPRLVLRELDRHGDIVTDIEPRELARAVSADTAAKVIEMMVTVTDQGGTGTRARIDGYRVAGKTGTAWKHMNGGYSATARIGSFVGLVPADDPRLAIVVVVDTPSIGSRFGGIVAAPAFSDIGAEALRLMGVAPDPVLLAAASATQKTTTQATADADLPPEIQQPGEPGLAWTAEGQLRIPDLTGLSARDALVRLDGTGLGLSLRGSGQVVEQSPLAGTALDPGDAVALVLR